MTAVVEPEGDNTKVLSSVLLRMAKLLAKILAGPIGLLVLLLILDAIHFGRKTVSLTVESTGVRLTSRPCARRDGRCPVLPVLHARTVDFNTDEPPLTGSARNPLRFQGLAVGPEAEVTVWIEPGRLEVTVDSQRGLDRIVRIAGERSDRVLVPGRTLVIEPLANQPLLESSLHLQDLSLERSAAHGDARYSSTKVTATFQAQGSQTCEAHSAGPTEHLETRGLLASLESIEVGESAVTVKVRGSVTDLLAGGRSQMPTVLESLVCWSKGSLAVSLWRKWKTWKGLLPGG